MYCKVFTDVTKTIADVLQDLNRRHKDNRRCIARSLQMSQRQSPMYCKILTDVTKTIADVLQDLNRRHKDNHRCIARSLQMSQRQSPMYCKILTDVTKTIADVLQDLYRGHKDNCHKSTNENAVPVTKSSPQDTLCKIVTNIHFTGVFKQFGTKLTFLSYLHVKMG